MLTHCSFAPVVWVCAALLGPLRGCNSCCLWFWQLVFGVHCGMPCQISPLTPTPSQTELSEVCSTMGESIRPSSLHNPAPLREEAHRTNLPLLAIGCRTDCSGERRTSPFNGIESSLSRAVIIKTKSLPISATKFPQRCLCTSRTIGECISTIQRSPRIITSYKFAALR